MSGIACDMCGKKLKVTITGGDFYVREGSTLDNINFEKAEDTSIITLDEPTEDEKKMDADTDLTVDICCSENSDHSLFSHTESRVKQEIYGRLKAASAAMERKYHSA